MRYFTPLTGLSLPIFHVVGVDRGAGHAELIGDGADVVAADLAELVTAGRVADDF